MPTKTKTIKNFVHARLYVKATFNNTLVNVTDDHGNSLVWSSSGNVGFKGSRKSTPFAATTAIEKALKKAQDLGIKKLSVYLKGPGLGRDAALRFLRSKRDFDVDMISDVTPVAHNGPRAPKQRKG
ncbi:30S ribosomal protein S11 [Patescibacteria group bacterium]|nr:30S ribosomal protein S11 [Patescibacteria group bacterium]